MLGLARPEQVEPSGKGWAPLVSTRVGRSRLQIAHPVR
jgi:hypothetical protein